MKFSSSNRVCLAVQFALKSGFMLTMYSSEQAQECSWHCLLENEGQDTKTELESLGLGLYLLKSSQLDALKAQ